MTLTTNHVDAALAKIREFHSPRVELNVSSLDPHFPAPEYATTGAAAFDLRVNKMVSAGWTTDMETGKPRQLLARGIEKIWQGVVTTVDTGLRVGYIPPNFSLFISIRSSYGRRGVMITNAPGIIDSDYRGRIACLVTRVAPANESDDEEATPDENGALVLSHGDRFAQATLVYTPKASLVMIGDGAHLERMKEATAESYRNHAGFGGTGNK